MEIKKELYGPKHIVTLGAAYDLALNMIRDGQYGAVKTLANQLLEWTIETVSEPSIMVVDCRQLLGEVWGRLGRVLESKAAFEQVLEARIRMLERKHPSTLLAMSESANCLDSLFLFEESETMFTQALHLMKETLGTKHTFTVLTASRLGLLRLKFGRIEERDLLATNCIGFC